MSDIPIQEDTGDYRMFSKRAIDALRQLKENERNMKGLFSYIGLKKKPIYYERDARAAGCKMCIRDRYCSTCACHAALHVHVKHPSSMT